MTWFCYMCQTLTPALNPALRICEDCYARFLECEANRLISIAGANGIPVEAHSLMAYRPLVRELVHRAKIDSQSRSLNLLVHYFTNHSQVLRLADWADRIVPAPSSAWGRLRGRYDLAYCLAHALARKSGKPVCLAPRHLFWRWNKQARRKSARNLREVKVTEASKEISDLNVLMVDDLITSGLTMGQLAQSLGFKHIRGVALAHA